MKLTPKILKDQAIKDIGMIFLVGLIITAGTVIGSKSKSEDTAQTQTAFVQTRSDENTGPDKTAGRDDPATSPVPANITATDDTMSPTTPSTNNTPVAAPKPYSISGAPTDDDGGMEQENGFRNASQNGPTQAPQTWHEDD